MASNFCCCGSNGGCRHCSDGGGPSIYLGGVAGINLCEVVDVTSGFVNGTHILERSPLPIIPRSISIIHPGQPERICTWYGRSTAPSGRLPRFPGVVPLGVLSFSIMYFGALPNNFGTSCFSVFDGTTPGTRIPQNSWVAGVEFSAFAGRLFTSCVLAGPGSTFDCDQSFSFTNAQVLCGSQTNWVQGINGTVTVGQS